MTALTAEPTVRATCYEVNVYPDLDSINASLFAVTVEHRGNDRWAVCLRGRVLGKRNNWSWERNPSSRTDRWINAYRHDLDTALSLAKKIAPHITVNGMTPGTCWEREQAQEATP